MFLCVSLCHNLMYVSYTMLICCHWVLWFVHGSSIEVQGKTSTVQSVFCWIGGRMHLLPRLVTRLRCGLLPNYFEYLWSIGRWGRQKLQLGIVLLKLLRYRTTLVIFSESAPDFPYYSYLLIVWRTCAGSVLRSWFTTRAWSSPRTAMCFGRLTSGTSWRVSRGSAATTSSASFDSGHGRSVPTYCACRRSIARPAATRRQAPPLTWLPATSTSATPTGSWRRRRWPLTRWNTRMRPRSAGMREVRSRNLRPAESSQPTPPINAESSASSAAMEHNRLQTTTTSNSVPLFFAAVTWYSHVIWSSCHQSSRHAATVVTLLNVQPILPRVPKLGHRLRDSMSGWLTDHFYLRDAMLTRYLPSSCVRPSVLLRWLNLGSRKQRRRLAHRL